MAQGFIGGWRDSNDEWHKVTDSVGNVVGPEPSSNDLANSDSIRIAGVDANGDIHWFTTSHLTPDYDLDDVLSDDGEHYGVEFV